MQTTLFGIPNCDQVRKARAWLADRGIDHVFHDFKKSGIRGALIAAWLVDVAADELINRKGTTWRGLSDVRKAQITNDQNATALMLELPSVIKRPVLQTADRTHVGFSDATYQQIFKQ